ncbi:MAG: molybdate ABC transporter substrate-binding protein [Pseudomonadota bacterium]
MAFLVILVSQVPAQDRVFIYAAASLQDAIDDATDVYENMTGIRVTPVYASTSAVARQIVAGAPADAVILADEEWGYWLAGQINLPAAVIVARNRLVLLGHPDAPMLSAIDQLSQALGDSPLAMADVEAVPAGQYGKAALTALGLWEQLEGRVVQAADVRAALRFVASGDVPFGVGYASDAVAMPDLSVAFNFPTETHRAIFYPAYSLTPSGAGFVEFLASEDGQDVLTEWGFVRAEAAQ